MKDSKIHQPSKYDISMFNEAKYFHQQGKPQQAIDTISTLLMLLEEKRRKPLNFIKKIKYWLKNLTSNASLIQSVPTKKNTISEKADKVNRLGEEFIDQRNYQQAARTYNLLVNLYSSLGNSIPPTQKANAYWNKGLALQYYALELDSEVVRSLCMDKAIEAVQEAKNLYNSGTPGKTNCERFLEYYDIPDNQKVLNMLKNISDPLGKICSERDENDMLDIALGHKEVDIYLSLRRKNANEGSKHICNTIQQQKPKVGTHFMTHGLLDRTTEANPEIKRLESWSWEKTSKSKKKI